MQRLSRISPQKRRTGVQVDNDPDQPSDVYHKPIIRYQKVASSLSARRRMVLALIGAVPILIVRRSRLLHHTIYLQDRHETIRSVLCSSEADGQDAVILSFSYLISCPRLIVKDMMNPISRYRDIPADDISAYGSLWP